MDEYDEYYESYEDAADMLDSETIIKIAFDELYRDVKNCKHITYSSVRETIKLNFADAPFGFEL